MIEPSVSTGGGVVLSALPEQLADYQQGDIVESRRLLAQGSDGAEYWVDTPDGAVLITQTCDIVSDRKRFVQVAPLVPMSGNNARLASKGAIPGRVAVYGAGENVFVDLEHIATVDKRYIAQFSPRRGMPTTGDLKRFGARVARKFSRFAFPDDVSYWLQPLKDTVLDKSGNANSALGRVLDQQVESLRLECVPSWDMPPPWQLVLVVIVRAGALPDVGDDDQLELPARLAQWLYAGPDQILRPGTAEIAGRLHALTPDSPVAERQWLWDAFAQSLAGTCRPKGAPSSAATAVADGRISWEVVTPEEFTYERFLRSEELDLDHLSAPVPR